MSDDLPSLPPVLQADLDAARRAMGLPDGVPPPPRIVTQEANAARQAALEAEVRRLRADNATLRAALQPLADLSVDDRDHADEGDDHWLTAGEIRAARAALLAGDAP